MTRPPLIGANQPVPPKQPEPPKEKPDDTKVLQIDSCTVITAMGQPSIAIFGLADNGEVYVWNMQTRRWVER